MRLGSVPKDLGPVSARVIDAVSKVSHLAWPILRTQCELLGLDPAHLQESDLPKLAPVLARAAARFTSPEKGEQLKGELLSFRKPPSNRPASGSPRTSTYARSLFSPSAPLGNLSKGVAAVLEKHSSLGWTVFEAQCQRIEANPYNITAAQLRSLLPALERAMARFTSPTKGQSAVNDLKDLLG